MIRHWAGTAILVLSLICSPFFIQPSISHAESGNDLRRQAFSDFEKEIFDLITSSVEPLNKLNGKLDEESLYDIALLTEQVLAKNNVALSKLKVPDALPDDIKESLENAKSELSNGFKALEVSMNYFAQYIANRSSLLYNKFVEKRDKGFLYIDGGLTTIATIRLRLDAPEKPIPNAWKVGKGNFYQLEKAISSKRQNGN